MKIIAIGGGGFTHGVDPELDDFVLAQSPVSNPKIGYIGAASNDLPERVDRFYRRFAGTDATASHVLQSTSGDTAADWVARQDIIYVGGGNTKHLLETWCRSGMDRILIDAARSGTVLAGVSAGAVCWFETAFSNLDGCGFVALAGLGIAAGSCCPHYSSEPERQPAFTAAVENGDLPEGIAIDDGVAILVDGRNPVQAFSARMGASAYHVRKSAGGTKVDHVAPVGQDNAPLI